jgi:FSR family fosmidomycin resistance protein-like MFS transporter
VIDHERTKAQGTAVAVLAGISLSHLLNDTVQALIPAIYPMLKAAFSLSFAQVGLMTLAQQLTASVLQPLIGLYTDRRPMPYSLVVGMAFSLVGLLLLAFAPTFGAILTAALLMGIGSAVFHPESSRVARMASGGRHGLAQSVFQVGGNLGSSFGPLLGAFLVLPRGQTSIAWCALLALVAMAVLWRGASGYSPRRRHPRRPVARACPPAVSAGRWRFLARSSSRNTSIWQA